MIFTAQQLHDSSNQLYTTLEQGGVIAYPTEGVYGLGCLATDRSAVNRIIQLKGRSPSQGLIVVIDCVERILPWLSPLPPQRWQAVLDSWPGAITWVLPTNANCPCWVAGSHRSIAVRLSAHPVVRTLCEIAEEPVVSTSANVHGQEALNTADTVIEKFGSSVDLIIDGECDQLQTATPIFDGLSGKQLRHP